MMKKSSTETAPKGRMPPKHAVMAGCIYHACGGINLGIKFTRTGGVYASFLYPKYEPTNTSGVETPTHKMINVKKVENGMAPELPSKSRHMSSTRKIRKTQDG